MPLKRVHGNVGAARQAAAGRASAVWSKMQQTWERRASGYGSSHTAKESECILSLSIYHYKFQECAVRLPTINNASLQSRDQHGWPIRALTTLWYAYD